MLSSGKEAPGTSLLMSIDFPLHELWLKRWHMHLVIHFGLEHDTQAI